MAETIASTTSRKELKRAIKEQFDTISIRFIDWEDIDFEEEQEFATLALINMSQEVGKDNHTGFFQVTIVSKKRGDYTLDVLADTVKTLFMNKTFETTNYSFTVFSTAEEPVDEFQMAIDFNFKIFN